MYQYLAHVLKVVDGDTIDCSIDLGFGISIKQRLRLARINAAERYTELGKEATEYLKASLASVGHEIIIKTDKQGKYGRWIAEIEANKICINDLLVAKGLATYYSS